MSGDHRHQPRVMGVLGSFAIHIIVAAIAFWPGGPAQRFASLERRAVLSNEVERDGVMRGPVVREPRAGGRSVTSPVAALGTPQHFSQLRGYAGFFQPAGTLATDDRVGFAIWLNHLWQSTLFALAAGLLTLAFRKNHARVRYWLWLSASLKFFIPFSFLMGLGSNMSWTPIAETTPSSVSFTVAQISQPFLESGASGIPYAPPFEPRQWLGVAVFAVWAVGFLVIARLRFRIWRRIKGAVTTSIPIEISGLRVPSAVSIRRAAGVLEPGVVGFWRPVILMPAGIENHLTPAQLETVVVHELCHIRYRDNSTAAVHMLVEAVFWFHPLVWWIGAELVRERERACDEHVLRVCGQPRVYAESIVNVCKRYVDTPLACVPGVSGSNLNQRIEAIMRNETGQALGRWRKLLLASVSVMAVAAPVVLGAVIAPLVRAQSPTSLASVPAFETASIKPNKSGEVGWRLQPQPGRVIAVNATAAALVRFAYDVLDFQMSGGPNWLDSDRFDVNATTAGDPPLAQKRAMVRRLLEDRFKLSAHIESRTLPIYALVMARSDGRPGPRLRRSDVDCSNTELSAEWAGIGPSPATGPPRCGFFGFAPGTDMPSGRGGLAFRGLTMAGVAKLLISMVHRSVSDQTALTGYFDGDFDFLSELPPPPPPPGMPNPWGRDTFLTVFTVFPEQLGLKLDARRGPVDVLIIDRAEQPTPD